MAWMLKYLPLWRFVHCLLATAGQRCFVALVSRPAVTLDHLNRKAFTRTADKSFFQLCFKRAVNFHKLTYFFVKCRRKKMHLLMIIFSARKTKRQSWSLQANCLQHTNKSCDSEASPWPPIWMTCGCGAGIAWPALGWQITVWPSAVCMIWLPATICPASPLPFCKTSC